MSILIKGMEMPKDGYIDVRVFAEGHANIATGEPPFYKEMPAIEMPPHGRLIDADVLVNEYEGDNKALKQRINDFPQAVENNKKLLSAIDFRRGFIWVLNHSLTIIEEVDE